MPSTHAGHHAAVALGDANAGRHGVLVKSAVVMEQLGLTDLVAFDKTGTLTEGAPRVAEIHPLAESGLDEEALLSLAAAAERASEHPLAAANLVGHLPLPLGVVGHEGPTVVVGLNGLRLLRTSAWWRAG